MSHEIDLMILGGGCAGLSLAMRLAKLGARCPQTVIVESRERYVNDRTWCFWGTPSAQLTSLVCHRWSRVRVSAESRRLEVDCASSPYEMIPASVFYEAALAAIAANPRIQLVTGASVSGQPVRTGDGWPISTPFGTHSPRWVVDTRPVRSPRRGDAVLWQSFYGREVRCDTDRFDAGCATLMDFLPVKDGRVVFVYMLPVTARQALIEVTAFSPEPLGSELLGELLDGVLTKSLAISKSKTVRAESGSLPMGLVKVTEKTHRNWCRAGLAGGGARPASGFAFQRIQRWADQCAEQLARGLGPCSQPDDPWRLRAMDDLFLRVLRAHPEAGPGLFMKLFAMQDSGPMIRFLSDCPRWSDCLRIILALPPGLFLWELLKGLSSRKALRAQPA
jgi:lycopene beta-cyclase